MGRWKSFGSCRGLKFRRARGSGMCWLGGFRDTILRIWINFAWLARWDGDGFRRIRRRLIRGEIMVIRRDAGG